MGRDSRDDDDPNLSRVVWSAAMVICCLAFAFLMSGCTKDCSGKGIFECSHTASAANRAVQVCEFDLCIDGECYCGTREDRERLAREIGRGL